MTLLANNADDFFMIPLNRNTAIAVPIIPKMLIYINAGPAAGFVMITVGVWK